MLRSGLAAILAIPHMEPVPSARCAETRLDSRIWAQGLFKSLAGPPRRRRRRRGRGGCGYFWSGGCRYAACLSADASVEGGSFRATCPFQTATGVNAHRYLLNRRATPVPRRSRSATTRSACLRALRATGTGNRAALPDRPRRSPSSRTDRSSSVDRYGPRS